MLNIRYEKTTNPKEIPGEDNPLKFGTIFTDHMFIMNYETGKGWFDPRIVPYQPLKMEPSSMGQTPAIAFNMVDLPAPLPPMTVTKSPSFNVRSTPFKATFSLIVPKLKVL